MFASRTKKTVEIKDGDAAVSVTLRKLSAVSLEKAANVQQQRAIQTAKLFGAEMFGELRKGSPEVAQAEANVAAAKASPQEQARARYAQYDRSTVLRSGIESWDAKDSRGKPVDVGKGIEDLDEDASTMLHEAILALSLGPLDPDEAEAAEGKS